MNIYWTSVTFITPTSGVVVGSYGAGGGEAIFYTSDGGRSFSPTKVVGVPKESPVVFGTPFEAGASIELPVLETTSSGGERFSLFVSHNGGASFSGPVGEVINVSGSFALGRSPLVAYGKTLWVVGERAIYESANNGRTWTTVSASDLSSITAMSLTSATSATAVAGSSQCAQFKADCTSKRYFVRTVNAGRTWKVLSSPGLPPTGFIAAQLFMPTNKVVYVLGSLPGGRVQLLRSDNGGTTFGQETMPPASRLETERQQGNFTVQFEGAERGVVVMASSVFVTSDGGGSWRRVPGPIGGPWVDFGKGNTVRIETAGSGRVCHRHPLCDRRGLPDLPAVQIDELVLIVGKGTRARQRQVQRGWRHRPQCLRVGCLDPPWQRGKSAHALRLDERRSFLRQACRPVRRLLWDHALLGPCAVDLLLDRDAGGLLSFHGRWSTLDAPTTHWLWDRGGRAVAGVRLNGVLPSRHDINIARSFQDN